MDTIPSLRQNTSLLLLFHVCCTLNHGRHTGNKADGRPSLTPLYLRSGGVQLVLGADLPNHYQHVVAAPVERHPSPASPRASAVP